MLIRKTAGFFLAALLLAASVLGILAAFPSRTAAADAPATLTTENADLFLPTSYEQYLALKNPVDVAVCDDYIAVADGDILYVYDRTKNLYSKTETATLEEDAIITKIGFAGNRLFVSTRAAGNHCYEYDFESRELNELKFNCSTFCISGNLLYTASVGGPQTTIAYYAISDLISEHPTAHMLGTLQESTTPSMTLLGGTLYCTVGEHVYYNDLTTNERFDDKQKVFYLTQKAQDARNVQSTCAHKNEFYYTAAEGLYRIELAVDGHSSQNAVRILEESDLGALTSFGGELYAVKDNAVFRIDIDGDEAKLSDYEITSASSSENRLAEATESVRAGDLLVTADAGNNRISVYDFAEKRFVTLSCENVKTVATDGEIIAAATDTGISIFEKVFNPKTLTREFSRTQTITVSNVAGVACVYDAIYFVTGDYYYGKIAREGDGWSDSKVQRMGNITPKAITADLFGDIFVAANDGNVYEFSEEDFATGTILGNSVANIDPKFTSLRAGFDGTLYYLDESGDFCNADGKIATIDGKDFVYLGEERQPVSFALGYEDDEVYFCFGDFIVKSNTGALGLATLETLSETVLKEAEATLSAVADADGVQLADCNQNAVCVHGNVGALLTESGYCNKGGDGKSYKRYTEARRGVVLDRQSEYSLVAVYENHVYTAEIFRNEDLGEPFAPEKKDGEGATMYISSNCPAYHFPCIADLPAREASPLLRGTKVNVLCYVNVGGAEEALGGYPFAYVEYETAARSTFQCYVPAAYLTAVDPLGETEETYTLGYVKPGTTFTGSDGHKTVTEERVQARLTRNEDGTYTAAYEKDGVVYTATVEEGQIDWGESDALRIALIVILSVLAFVIIGAYVFLLPWNKKQIK